MTSTLIVLIVVTFALVLLRRYGRPGVWLAGLMAGVCALLSTVPIVRAATLNYPAFTEVVNVSANTGNSNYPQIASKGDGLKSFLHSA